MKYQVHRDYKLCINAKTPDGKLIGQLIYLPQPFEYRGIKYPYLINFFPNEQVIWTLEPILGVTFLEEMFSFYIMEFHNSGQTK